MLLMFTKFILLLNYELLFVLKLIMTLFPSTISIAVLVCCSQTRPGNVLEYFTGSEVLMFFREQIKKSQINNWQV